MTGYTGRVVPATKRGFVAVKDPVITDEKEVESGEVVDKKITNTSNVISKCESSGACSGFTQKYTKTQKNPPLCEDNVVGDIGQALTDFVAFTSVLESFQGNFINPLTNAIVDMEQQIRSTAQQIQRIIRSALNNIRTGLIKRIMSLF